ncbi:hypothetical protein SISSUDRAFT_1066497 [Sistotremastrum suecicum HHB10207 ss-3]|uniref:Uncharacterized protein n=1 Tax=Sistotremastrum suecicum HHB10207 ss-3 TaxID=1314776 RepID=A0A165Y8V2_9AGAM|nr:hypothetical protein SISSUDRAFT_1066497 [Sistotremastrum suecicum HHB10207 ss-3]
MKVSSSMPTCSVALAERNILIRCLSREIRLLSRSVGLRPSPSKSISKIDRRLRVSKRVSTEVPKGIEGLKIRRSLSSNVPPAARKANCTFANKWSPAAASAIPDPPLSSTSDRAGINKPALLRPPHLNAPLADLVQ